MLGLAAGPRRRAALAGALLRRQGVSARRGVSTRLLDRRCALWDREAERQGAAAAAEAGAAAERAAQVTLLGKAREVALGATRPLDLARRYDQKQAKHFVVARVNGDTLWDMRRPLPAHTADVELLRFDGGDAAAKEVFWHSSAHVMGAALERVYGDDLLLCDGPALPGGGFFYEFLLLGSSSGGDSAGPDVDRLDAASAYRARIDQLCGADVPLGSLRFLAAADLGAVQKAVTQLVAESHAFARMEVPYDLACEMFLDNPFKLHFLDRARRAAAAAGGPHAGTVSLYRCGGMVDLCRGPHVANTSQLQAIVPERVSAAHWVGHLHPDPDPDPGRDGGAGAQQTAPVLNRIYGVSFPSQAMLRAHRDQLELAARRDHRVIGRDQRLFMMHPWAPGSGFILPHGQRMVNAIMAAIRQKYGEYGFDEVSTPLMYNRRLWETSGHWENYRDDMFAIAADAAPEGRPAAQGCCSHSGPKDDAAARGSEPEFGLKPMNCPGHCLIFASDQRSYRDLPIRYADFSPLHRNEIAGALSGLTRVRKFHQDDGHIFCTRAQVAGEIEACLRLIGEMYEMLGFPAYEMALSTRPARFLGEAAEWDEAEAALRDALDRSGRPWMLNAGDGAFYGPKIDVRVQDCLGRRHQTATVQLDFQLPQRFELKYADADGAARRPVMIHRAVLGSMERMLAILIEHWGGRWPFWVNPRQAIVIPTTTAPGARRIADYAQQVRDALAGDRDPACDRRFFVDVDLSSSTLGRAVRDAQLAQYSFILVVGEKEADSGTVDVRPRQGARIGAMTVDAARAMFVELARAYK
ncbi:hypothetical protein H4R18_005268 [Coemansia javaensis]|uniref:threonine--tRNA ligase n=1 Tax=Coemansia javaensis TaxID=2761396 RepID=A0A9W8H2G6_9FUNG|nr:hypothetical protein H4R18_005268 [Coemansia javaensis]